MNLAEAPNYIRRIIKRPSPNGANLWKRERVREQQQQHRGPFYIFSPDYNSKTGKGKEQRMRVKALGDQEKREREKRPKEKKRKARISSSSSIVLKAWKH